MDSKLSWGLDGDSIKIKTTGNCVVEDLLEIIEKALGDTSTPEKVAIIIDAIDAEIERRARDYLQIAERLISNEKQIRCIAYVTLSKSMHEIIRQAAKFAKFNQLGEVCSFSDLESAENWINELQ